VPAAAAAAAAFGGGLEAATPAAALAVASVHYWYRSCHSLFIKPWRCNNLRQTTSPLCLYVCVLSCTNLITVTMRSISLTTVG
jgi:hypothetical protein